MADSDTFIRGRGAQHNPRNRYGSTHKEPVDDGWGDAPALADSVRQVVEDAARSVIARNNSPDVPFSQSINPYRGCEHGCVYCFARPSHAWLGYSPGLEFETRLHVKTGVAERLREELGRPAYQCSPLALGVNTDAYQPLERRYEVSRSILEVCLEARQPVSIVTKSAGIERDLDVLREMAKLRLVHVMVSVTTLDRSLSSRMEPRAAPPQRRLTVIERLTEAGIPVGVLMAPVIPFINDHEIESVVKAVHAQGALTANYVFLRLPHELTELFEHWLQQYYPDRADRVMGRIRDSRGGRTNDSRFGQRMRGEGVFADLINQRFRKASSVFAAKEMPALNCEDFRAPSKAACSPQLALFASMDSPPSG